MAAALEERANTNPIVYVPFGMSEEFLPVHVEDKFTKH